jgi:hypothetical protein
MIAQHRRELHTNLLADRMGRLVRNVQSAPKSTSIILWSFVVLAAGTFIIWEYAARSSQGSSSALWARVDIALHSPQEGTGQLDNAAKQLDNVAKENPGTIPGRAARFEMARLQFERGQTNLTSFDDIRRTAAAASLKHAQALYQQLAKECADAPLLAQEAMMGRAKAEEALVSVSNTEKPDEKLGDLDRALEYYRALAGKYPESILGQQAKAHIKELEDNRSKVESFYVELNELVPLKPALPKTQPDVEKKISDSKSATTEQKGP